MNCKSDKNCTQDTTKIPVVISTWNFGEKANKIAYDILDKGGSALDAVEKGINEIELDPSVTSVGYGGLPSEDGEVELDAMIMWGPKHEAGAVGALKYIKTPISVARRVMEKTKHTLLVGDGALEFALKEGFKKEELLTESAKKAWEDFKKDKKDLFRKHDTIGVVAIDKDGNICAGCSTSGLAFKLKSRVGDSPIIGSGVYCDNDIGGASATGNGDFIMRFCLSYSAVEFMRQGLSPTKACEAALQRAKEKGIIEKACLIALDKKGEFGAAKLGVQSFPYAVANKDLQTVYTIAE